MKKQGISNRRLYCILDLDLPYFKKNPLSVTEDLIAGGADIIQLRTKDYSTRDIIEIGKKIRYLTRKNNVIFIVNDRVDIAKAIEADGVHLGQEDLPPNIARRVLGRNRIIGLSTHSLVQARTALNYDINYISVGPVFKSPTRPELKPIGIERLRKIVKISSLPVVAIGGITTHNLKIILSCRVNSIAVISAVLSSKDIRQKTREFKKKLYFFYNEH